MVLYFVTGSEGKFIEASLVFNGLKQLDLDLPEIQELNAKKIVEEKLKSALDQTDFDELFIEDTTLELACLNGFPGPLTKWMWEALKDEGMFDLIRRYEDDRVVAKSIVGYAKRINGNVEIKFFEAALKGNLVRPRGDNDFGWGALFQPFGLDKTFGEMSRDEKNAISMRGKAFIQLKEYLKDTGSNS